MGHHPSDTSARRTPRPIADTDLSWIIGLNTQFESELSPLTRADLVAMVRRAFYARVVPPQAGFLVAFDQDSDYASPNFLWFRRRVSRFVYVDRIAIVESARGQGLARRLYLDLFEQAGAVGHDRIVCEVNIDPPNPASDAFHARLDFTEIGRAKLSNAKSVRYLKRVL